MTYDVFHMIFFSPESEQSPITEITWNFYAVYVFSFSAN